MLALPIACVTAGTAAATPLGDPSVSSCTTENCSSVTIGGTVLKFGGGTFNANPWVAEIYAGGNECLRLDVLAQNVDLEIVAVAPNGFVFWNGDRIGSGGGNRPLVKIPQTYQGWYTVHVNEAFGAGADADFTLAFGRYAYGNPNCAPPTPAIVPDAGRQAAAAVKRGAYLDPRATGGPGGR